MKQFICQMLVILLLSAVPGAFWGSFGGCRGPRDRQRVAAALFCNWSRAVGRSAKAWGFGGPYFPQGSILIYIPYSHHILHHFLKMYSTGASSCETRHGTTRSPRCRIIHNTHPM